MLCATCELPTELTRDVGGALMYLEQVPFGLRRDVPLPPHAGPRACRPKVLEALEIRIEEDPFRRDYNTSELRPTGDAEYAVAEAILGCFWMMETG
jgi:hypothetical protein